MNKLLFDLWPLQYGTSDINGADAMGGAAEYCKTILTHMIMQGKKFDVLLYSNFKLLDEFHMMIDSSQSEVEKVYINSLEELSAKLLNYEVFYSALPYSYGKLKIPSKTKFIYTIHGLRDIEKKWDKYYLVYEGIDLKHVLKMIEYKFFVKHMEDRYRLKMQKLVDSTNNRKIICVSNHTKYSVLTNLNNVHPDEIEVLYSPRKTIENDNDANFNDYITDKFILLTRGDHWIKNDLRACIALDELISEGRIDYKIVVIGVSDKKIYERRIKNIKNFIFDGYVSSPRLESLYKKASLFIFPSLNEGFGYPPIECMKYGTKTVCAADSSIMEVCGGDVIYFNPYDIEEIKIRIIQSLNINTENYSEHMKKRAQAIKLRQDSDLEALIKLIT